MPRPLIQLLKLVVLVAVVAFVAVAVAKDLRKVDDWSAFRPSPLWLLAALVAQLGISAVQIVSYRTLLHAYGARPTWRQMATIAWVPALGKYVPGKVVTLIAATAMLRRYGVDPAVAVSVVLMQDALAVGIGLMVGAPLAVAYVPGGWWVIGACIGIGCVCLHPAVFGRMLDVVLRKLKRRPLERMPSTADYAVPVLCAASQWAWAGLALWCMANSLGGELSARSLPSLAMTQAAAMTLGYLALIAPGGLGVTDGIRLVVLKGLLPTAGDGQVAMIVVAMRLMQTAVEVGLAGVGAAMMRGSTPATPGTAWHGLPARESSG